jgi:CheY-like chemotaxis protein
MMALSRRTVAAPVLLAANEAVGEAMRFLRRVVGEHVQVTTALAPDAWSTRIDPGQLAQVLMNLVVNARDAMPGGGRLAIETRNAPGERDPAGADGDYVCVAVSDTGCGMSEEVQARIFEPFFTTKEPGKGTGLGLSMVYGIVRGAGGFVRCDSAPGAGTTFHVFLPRADGAAEAGAAARPAGAGGELAGDLTVLVAEDEEPLRQLVVRSLGQLGVRVLHGCDGEDALAVARRHRGRIDLLVTDVVMPRLSGPDLAAALGRDRPGLKVLYMTGFPRDGNLEGAGAVLEKPFRQSALLEQVRRLVAG